GGGASDPASRTSGTSARARSATRAGGEPSKLAARRAPRRRGSERGRSKVTAPSSRSPSAPRRRGLVVVLDYVTNVQYAAGHPQRDGLVSGVGVRPGTHGERGERAGERERQAQRRPTRRA